MVRSMSGNNNEAGLSLAACGDRPPATGGHQRHKSSQLQPVTASGSQQAEAEPPIRFKKRP